MRCLRKLKRKSKRLNKTAIEKKSASAICKRKRVFKSHRVIPTFKLAEVARVFRFVSFNMYAELRNVGGIRIRKSRNLLSICLGGVCPHIYVCMCIWYAYLGQGLAWLVLNEKHICRLFKELIQRGWSLFKYLLNVYFTAVGRE